MTIILKKWAKNEYEPKHDKMVKQGYKYNQGLARWCVGEGISFWSTNLMTVIFLSLNSTRKTRSLTVGLDSFQRVGGVMLLLHPHLFKKNKHAMQAEALISSLSRHWL